ncbi:MAG: hypothetical protein FWD14_06645 [Treponema sp.]|nr:hypothetical protein [Treponema sp.]
MKKFLFFLLISFFAFSFLYADEEPEESGADPKKPFRIPDRFFEIGLGANVHFSNNYLTIRQIFSDTIVLDLDDFDKNFNAAFGFGVTPFYFNFDSKKGWGFGLSAGLEAAGVIDISRNLLLFNEVKDDKSSFNGAVFATTEINTFFPVQKFKVSFKPAVYYPIAYFTSDLFYTFSNSSKGTEFNIGYDMYLYTAAPADGSSSGLTATPGFDFSFGLEYPLSKEIGLNEKYSFLDFDVGLDFVNIPVFSSTLRDYSRIYSRMGTNGSIYILGDDNDDAEFISEDITTYGEKIIRFQRPFKVLLWANWRPFFGNQLFTFKPLLGFSVNQIYDDPFSVEAGFNARIDLFNLFITTAGINYTDRTWINSLDFAFNLRAFQFDFGIDMRSQNFIKSWQAGGVGFKTGIRFGW